MAAGVSELCAGIGHVGRIPLGPIWNLLAQYKSTYWVLLHFNRVWKTEVILSLTKP